MNATEQTENTENGSGMTFSILKQGTVDPMGPLSEADILKLLNDDEISPHDLVYYEGIEQWTPLAEVFVIEDQISHFVDDGQDTAKVGAIFREVSNVLTKGEDIFYIAIQEKTGILSKSKSSVVIAGGHIFLLKEIRTGWEIEAHQWSHISNTLMRDEGKGLGTFSILLNLEKKIDVAHIPMKQLRRLFQLSQELRESGQ